MGGKGSATREQQGEIRNDAEKDERDARHEEELISNSELTSSMIALLLFDGESRVISDSKESSSSTSEEEKEEEEEEEVKFYDPADTTLTFVKGEDDLDFLCADYKSLRAQMSCGHAVTPTSLNNWCCYLLDQGDCKFVCGQTGCDVVWPFEEVCKMALLTPEEIEDFEKKVFQNAAKDFLDVKCCPGCKSRVMRTDLNNLSVECSVCTVRRKRTYTFCWQCLKEWKGPVWSDHCGNGDCKNPLETLSSCSDITFKDVRGVTGCPSIRACPTCGLLVEHKGTQCKNIVCDRCKVEFRFVCLKLTKDCVDEKTRYYNLCSGGVTPRQTTMPVWRRR